MVVGSGGCRSLISFSCSSIPCTPFFFLFLFSLSFFFPFSLLSFFFLLSFHCGLVRGVLYTGVSGTQRRALESVSRMSNRDPSNTKTFTIRFQVPGTQVGPVELADPLGNVHGITNTRPKLLMNPKLGIGNGPFDRSCSPCI
jgi:hypothetical protein